MYISCILHVEIFSSISLINAKERIGFVRMIKKQMRVMLFGLKL